MTHASEGPPRVGCADGPEVVCFGGEQFPDSAPAQKNQAQIGRAPHLRLVPPAPPPRPRLVVRISAFRDREPVGRTRPLMLRESDLAWLIEEAERRVERA
jgi:hypothetical protein